MIVKLYYKFALSLNKKRILLTEYLYFYGSICAVRIKKTYYMLLVLCNT